MPRLPAVRWPWSPLALLLAGCIDATAPSLDPTVDGYWLGTSQGVLIALELAQDGGEVTGTGTIMGAIPIPFTVREGSHTFPNLTLIADPRPRAPAFRVEGLVFRRTIAATLDGSGFRDFDVHLERY